MISRRVEAFVWPGNSQGDGKVKEGMGTDWNSGPLMDGADGGRHYRRGPGRSMSGAARKWAFITFIGLISLALAVLLLWKWAEWRAEARIVSAYAAHMACSCRYVVGRDMEGCKQDSAREAGFVRLSDQVDEKRVTGNIFLLATSSARLKPGYGCVME